MPDYLEGKDKGHIDSIKIEHKPGSVDNRMIDPGLFPFDAFEYDNPNAEGITCRYIRDWVAGNSVDNTNYWVEIEALDADGVNVAAGILPTVASGDTLTNGAYITDGNTNSANYAEVTPSDNLNHYVEIDLGSEKLLKTLKIWHYYADGRTYHGTKTEVSLNAEYWLVVFDSKKQTEYIETSAGNILTLTNIPLLKLMSPWQFEIEPNSGINASSSLEKYRGDIENKPTYSEVVNGYEKGGGTKIPTVPTITKIVGKYKSIILTVDTQTNLTNPDGYEAQVSSDETNWYSLKEDGTDWKGTLNAWTHFDNEKIGRAHV